MALLTASMVDKIEFLGGRRFSDASSSFTLVDDVVVVVVLVVVVVVVVVEGRSIDPRTPPREIVAVRELLFKFSSSELSNKSSSSLELLISLLSSPLSLSLSLEASLWPLFLLAFFDLLLFPPFFDDPFFFPFSLQLWPFKNGFNWCNLALFEAICLTCSSYFLGHLSQSKPASLFRGSLPFGVRSKKGNNCVTI